MSKAKWLIAGYVAFVATAAVVWAILFAIGEPIWRGLVLAALLTLGLGSWLLAGIWVYGLIKQWPHDRRGFLTMGIGRAAQGSGFALLPWARWVAIGLVLFGVGLPYTLRRGNEVSDTKGV